MLAAELQGQLPDEADGTAAVAALIPYQLIISLNQATVLWKLSIFIFQTRQ